MKTDNSKLSAFAAATGGSKNGYLQEGLTKREYFAILAMQGLLESDVEMINGIRINGTNSLDLIPKRAIEYADELLKQLESKTKSK